MCTCARRRIADLERTLESQRVDIALLTRERNELQAAVTLAVDALVRANERYRVAEEDADALARYPQHRTVGPNTRWCDCASCVAQRKHIEALKARVA